MTRSQTVRVKPLNGCAKEVGKREDSHRRTQTQNRFLTLLFLLCTACVSFKGLLLVAAHQGCLFHNKKVKYVDSIQGQDHLCTTIQLVSSRTKCEAVNEQKLAVNNITG